MDCSLPGSSVHETSQAEYWHGLQFPSPGHLTDPEIESMSHALAVGFFNAEPPGKPVHGVTSILKMVSSWALIVCMEYFLFFHILLRVFFFCVFVCFPVFYTD